MTQLLIPDLGNTNAVDVIEVLVKVGDSVSADQTVLVLETEKATVEIPAEYDGIISSMQVKVGDQVTSGTVFGTIDVQAGAEQPVVEAAAEKPAVQEQAVQKQASPQATPDISTNTVTKPEAAAVLSAVVRSNDETIPYAGPAVRKLARELGVELSQVRGTGLKQRITKEDVQSFVKQRMQAPSGTGLGVPAVPEIDFSQFGPITRQPLNNIKRATARAMTMALLNVPQVTQFDEADITELEQYRQRINAQNSQGGVRLSLLPFLLKVLARTLKDFPTFNASLSPDGSELILKQYVHLGVAVDTPKGLLVPVIRDVGDKTITEITQELQQKASIAREGKLTLADMQGGCFSVSSLGGIGGTGFTPIVTPPDVAILGVSKACMKPVWNGNEFVPRLMLPLSLSYDHRVIDGAEAARFTQRLVVYLQDLRDILL